MKNFAQTSRTLKKWGHIVHELNLSPTELAAIATQDEDALRRLAGAEPMIAGQGLGFDTTNLLCSLLCFCFPFVTFLIRRRAKDIAVPDRVAPLSAVVNWSREVADNRPHDLHLVSPRGAPLKNTLPSGVRLKRAPLRDVFCLVLRAAVSFLA